uniref:Uncharacterized protein LOC113789760 n=2 Tax=Dermatophagoides pteronyssinus TaxID=6956 RepID=A0A6P6XT99_DERPT|nr:uncharacterized protein LOC113789760 [Dermatophagoides pteronyssinus]
MFLIFGLVINLLARLLRFSDQKTLKHIDWTLFGLEIIFTIAPVIYAIAALIATIIFTYQLYQNPPVTTLIFLIELYVFGFGIIVIFIIIMGALWLFIDAELRTIYFQDCFLQLNSMMKNSTKFIQQQQQNRSSLNYSIECERQIMFFIFCHNFLCWFLNKINPWWKRRNLTCVALTIPNNAMMVNLLLFQTFEPKRFLVLFAFTALQFLLAAIAIGIIPAINYYAIGSRQSLFDYLALLSTTTTTTTKHSISIRTKIKTLVYLERITSERMLIGAQIGIEQYVITYASYWQFIGLYIGYFFRSIKLFYSNRM